MTAPKRMPRRGCVNCGGPCTVDAVDNSGNRYKGCPNCRVKSLDEIAAMTAPKPPGPPKRVTLAWDSDLELLWQEGLKFPVLSRDEQHVYVLASVVTERERELREALSECLLTMRTQHPHSMLREIKLATLALNAAVEKETGR